MFKKITAGLGLLLYVTAFLCPFNVYAQDNSDEDLQSPEEQVEFKATISSSDSVEIEKNIIFDASKTTHPDSEKELIYTWDFGDGNKKEGVEVVHTYTDLGTKSVTLTVSDGDETVSDSKEILIYKKIILFVTDKVNLRERLEGFRNYARDRNVDIVVIESYESATEFISEEILVRKLGESTDSIRRIDDIVVATDGDAGLNALSRVKQKHANLETVLSFEEKNILVLVGDQQRVGQAQRHFDILNPEYIIIAKEAAIYPYIDSEDPNNFINRLKTDGYDYELITAETGKIQIWNFMSYFTNYLIDSGIPANTVILILMLPVIATIVAFMKQVVGLTTFGVYTPSIITLTFWILGLRFGILTLLVVFLVGTGARYALKRFRLLYIPKMAIVLTCVALAILAMLIISIHLDLFNAQFFALAIFPMLILSTLTEKFVNVQSGKGFKKAIFLTLQSVIVSIVAYIVIGGEIDLFIVKLKFSAMQRFMMSYPEVILIIIFINVFLGKWTGLRLLEYVRFREVLRHVEEE